MHLWCVVCVCVCVCVLCVCVCVCVCDREQSTASALSIQPVLSQYSLCPLNTACALPLQPLPMVGFLRVRLGIMLDWNTSFAVVLLTAGDKERHTETIARRQQCQTVLLCYRQNGQATKSDGKLLIRRICIAIEANV